MSKQGVGSDDKFPVFRNPEEYMAMRHKPGLVGRAKVWSERRALEQCFSVMPGVQSVMDVPSGPGRLFWYWKEKGLRVIGLDYSEQMVEASADCHRELGLEGRVERANAFELPELPEGDRPDVVASVRFAYYFKPAKRVELLRSLAGASSRYLLVMYKTTESLKGYINEASDREEGKAPRQPHMAKAGCSHHQIMREFTAAGLAVLRIQPIGEFSDRVYVVAEKVSADSTPLERSEVAPIRIRSGSSTGIGFVLIALLFLFYFFSLSVREFWREPEALLGLAVRNALAGNWLTPWNGIPGSEFESLSLPFVWLASLISPLMNGVNEVGLRFLNALFLAGGLSIPLLLGRQMKNRYIAVMGALMLATCYDFWKLATEVRPEVTSMVLLGGAWLAAWGGVTRGGRAAHVVSWSFAGVAALSAGWEPLVLTALAWIGLPMILASRGERRAGGGVASALGGMLIALWPVVLWTALALYFADRAVVFEWLRLHWGLRGFGYEAPWYVVWGLAEGSLPWVLLLPVAVWQRFRPGGVRRTSAVEDYCLYITLSVIVAYIIFPHDSDEAYALLLPWLMISCAGVAWRWLLWVGQGVSDEDARKDRRVWGTLLGRLPGKVFLGLTGLLLLGYTAAIVLMPLLQGDRDSPRAAIANINRYLGDRSPLIVYNVTDSRLLYYLGDDVIHISVHGRRGVAELEELLDAHADALLLISGDDRDELAGILTDPERIGRIRFRGDRLLVVDPSPGDG